MSAQWVVLSNQPEFEDVDGDDFGVHSSTFKLVAHLEEYDVGEEEGSAILGDVSQFLTRRGAAWAGMKIAIAARAALVVYLLDPAEETGRARCSCLLCALAHSVLAPALPPNQ